MDWEGQLARLVTGLFCGDGGNEESNTIYLCLLVIGFPFPGCWQLLHGLLQAVKPTKSPCSMTPLQKPRPLNQVVHLGFRRMHIHFSRTALHHQTYPFAPCFIFEVCPKARGFYLEIPVRSSADGATMHHRQLAKWRLSRNTRVSRLCRQECFDSRPNR